MRELTVLLVDDEIEIREAATLRLRAAGYRTVDATDGEQALSAATSSPPDVIVLDVRMPRKDGLETMADLRRRQETRNIPIVMLSASIVDQQAALDAGARFFLTKPYRGQELLAAVRTAIDEREHQ